MVRTDVTNGAAWQGNMAVKTAERGLTADSYITVYLPYDTEVSSGDMILLGDVTVDNPTVAALRACGAPCTTVMAVSYNRGLSGGTSHVKAVGK